MRFQILGKRRTLAATIALLLLSLAFTGCAGDGVDVTATVAIDDDALQLAPEAMAAIAMSQQALVDELGVDIDDIEVQNVTEPASPDDPYIVHLRVNGEIYEYHVQRGEALRITLPTPTAPVE